MEITSDFESYFSGVYADRWPVLKQALLKDSPKIQMPCFGGFATYTLDAASVLAARSLPLTKGDHVLDMCAAPGGKALVLLEQMVQANAGTLIANELSFARRKRLEEVIRQHVPPEHRSRVKVTSWDASKIGIKAPAHYEKILLDAPCSSERHMLEQDATMKDWKMSRTKQLAQRQYALICSALLALKPGGVMVYSTCSISPLENDGVVERLLERKGEQVSLFEGEVPSGVLLEKTKYGFQIFPDRSEGQGPIYFSRLIKN